MLSLCLCLSSAIDLHKPAHAGSIGFIRVNAGSVFYIIDIDPFIYKVFISFYYIFYYTLSQSLSLWRLNESEIRRLAESETINFIILSFYLSFYYTLSLYLSLLILLARDNKSLFRSIIARSFKSLLHSIAK